MSELCMHEFEDIVWGELCPSDDHTVPHPGFEKSNGNSILLDSPKKPWPELSSDTLNARDKSAAGYVYKTREHIEFASVSEIKDKMLEKSSWTHAQSDMFPSSPEMNSTQETSSLASKNNVSPSHGLKSNDTDSDGKGFCMNLDDKTTTVDENSFSYRLGGATHTENNIGFFEDAGAGDSGDLFGYDWPEIGNFEDVDRMFRSCDSTFGLEGSKDDGLGWLPSADEIGELKNEMKSDLRFTSPDNDSNNLIINDSAMTSAAVAYEDNLWISDKSESYLAFADGNNDIIAKGQQTIKNRMQSEQQKLSGGKRKEHNLGNGSFSYLSNFSNEVTQFPSETTSHLDFSSGALQQHHALGPSSYGFVQNPFTYMHSGNKNQSPSALKSENNDLSSLSQRNSSVLSSNVPHTESFSEPLQLVNVPERTGKREKLQHCHNSQSSINGSIVDASVAASLSESTKQVQLKFENHNSDAEGVSQVIPAELGSSNVQESQTGSSGAEDNSIEAASFLQLQLIMEQLDLKTKLCIRDSLYRLARSAEQRHNHGSPSGDERGGGVLMGEDSSNFIDMETQTNPIDRSVAHLLFHRASESSDKIPSRELLTSKLPFAVHGSSVSPRMKRENLISREETASENRESG